MAFDLDQFKRELTVQEGRRYEPYTDTFGQLKSGVGHILTDKEKTQFSSDKPASREQVDEWLDNDVREACVLVQSILGAANFEKLDGVRKRAICNLAFNVGRRLVDFEQFIAAMKNCDYEKAAEELAKSDWYKQVKFRGPEVVEQIKSGENIGRIAAYHPYMFPDVGQ